MHTSRRVAPVLAALALGLSAALATPLASRQPPDPKPAPADPAAATDDMEKSMASLRTAIKDESLTRVIGFWVARLEVLDRIEREFPALKDKAARAKAAMLESFGPGYDAIFDLYLSRGGSREADWDKAKAGILKSAADQKLSEADLAAAFESGSLEPQHQQAKYAQLLLFMNPAHQRKPELAFDQGFTNAIPLAPKGGKPFGSIKVPMTFGLISGEKPGDALTFAYASFAPATITVTVNPIAAPMTPKQAVDNLVAAKSPKLTPKPDQATFLDTPAGKAALVPVDITIDSGKVKSLGRGTMFLLPTPTQLIGVVATVQVSGGEDQDARAGKLLPRFEPLFERVRASIVVEPVEKK